MTRATGSASRARWTGSQTARFAVGIAIGLAVTACGAAELAPEPSETPDHRPTPLPAATAAEPRPSGAVVYQPEVSAPPDGSLDRAVLDRVLAAGPGWLLQQVPLEPTFAGKHKFSGFRIAAVFHNDPRALRFGVLPGDILQAVNGQKIVTPGDLLLAFERLRSANELEVSVTRGGEVRTFRQPIWPPLPAAEAPDPAPLLRP